jgi:hypothetical protein
MEDLSSGDYLSLLAKHRESFELVANDKWRDRGCSVDGGA